MDAVIYPGALHGKIAATPSVSLTYRYMVCAALADGLSVLHPVLPCDDLRATAAAVQALGAGLRFDGEECIIRGVAPGKAMRRAVIDCGENQATLCCLLPIAAALGCNALFKGRGGLLEHPPTPLLSALSENGITCTCPPGAGNIVEIGGQLKSGVFRVPGDAGTHYISGLLLALPLLAGDSELHLTTALRAADCVALTLQAIFASGVRLVRRRDTYYIPGGQRYSLAEADIEGDFTSAAVWLCAGALGAPVTVTGLRPESLQGDRAVLSILRRFGADVVMGENVRISPRPLRAIELSAADIPDIVPALAVVAAFAQGETQIHDARRLRLAEGDRLAAIIGGLHALGAQIRQGPDSLHITGLDRLPGGTADSCGDHRVAMALSIAAVRSRAPVRIRGTACVEKSYPDFFDDLRTLGAHVELLRPKP